MSEIIMIAKPEGKGTAARRAKVIALLLFAMMASVGIRFCGSAPSTQRENTAHATPLPSAAPQGDFDPAARVREADVKTRAALAGLKPNFSAQDLVNALNQNRIQFAPGSAEIPAAQSDLLNKMARAIRNAPAGTRLEIGAHTDSRGVALENVKLTQARADALKAFLVSQGAPADRLTARGYGDVTPRAGNTSEAGRFENNRIEFLLLREQGM